MELTVRAAEADLSGGGVAPVPTGANRFGGADPPRSCVTPVHGRRFL